MQIQAQEQALQTTSVSLLEEFENNNDNPAIENGQESQTSSDGVVSRAPTVSSKNNPIQPPTVTHQLPSLDNESITTKPVSSQLSDTGTSPQIANSSSLPRNSLSESNVIPNAMNVLLDMNDTDISQEVMVYESEGVDSEVSPNSSLSFTQPTPPYTTPPNFAVNRSFSLPPRNFHSQMWPGAGQYRHYSFSDYVSET